MKVTKMLISAMEDSQSCRPDWWYNLVIGFIAAVSVYDAALVLWCANVISFTEQNPVGQFLIQINGGDPTLFVLLKLVGTTLTVLALRRLFQQFRHLAVPVVAGVASVQMSLLLYLSFA